MLATQYADYYSIKAQGDDEGDMAFRRRISGALREMGRIIEAHEAYQDERYEQSDAVMTGVTGAIAQAFAGIQYSGDSVGNDIAAGMVAQAPERALPPEMVLLAAMLFK